jgi:hypothetical protein
MGVMHALVLNALRVRFAFIYLFIMIPSALMILSMLLTGVKSPGNCSGFPCCTKPVNNPEYDPKGKAYGYENGQSCVF